jgi:hypothetical protein
MMSIAILPVSSRLFVGSYQLESAGTLKCQWLHAAGVDHDLKLQDRSEINAVVLLGANECEVLYVAERGLCCTCNRSGVTA